MTARPLLVLRPEPGNAATLAAARAAGLDAHGFPLFAVEPRAWTVPDPASCDAILVGSANVFRHGGDGLALLRRIPVWAVGETTAKAAQDAGFIVERTGVGGLQRLLDQAPAGRLLRLAGERRTRLTPPAGVTIETRTVYAARERPLDGAAIGLLVRGAVVALHSGEAARHFAAECERLRLDREGVALVCLAPRVATLAAGGWRACEVAGEPSDSALLALAGQMCQT